MEAMIISGKWGKMLQFLVKTPREIDYSIADAFENNCFLFLWHFLAKLVAGVAANRWIVGHVCAVYDHSRLVALNVSGFRLYIYISKLIYAGKLLHLFRKLFKKQIFSCISLRRRFFVWQLGFMHLSGSARGVVVYQYTRKKFAKIPQNTQNSSKYNQNYTQVYFIPEIQRKWYTEYPYLSCNIPYTRFKKPLYTVYPKTLADPDLSIGGLPRGYLWTVLSIQPKILEISGRNEMEGTISVRFDQIIWDHLWRFAHFDR